MSESPGRVRRAWEWLWRGSRLRELKPQRLPPSRRGAVEEARSCQTLAWRALAGLEPIPASARPVVARPLILTGLSKCLPLAGKGYESLDELLADPVWREHLVRGGLDAQQLPALRAWLLESAQDADTKVGAEHALRALGAVLEALQAPEQAVRAVLWRRALVLALALASFAAVAAGIVVLLTPPEGPDLAAGKPWRASSFYPGFPASGSKPVNPPEGAFFSTTNEEQSPWWVVDLQVPTTIASATIVNRSDCCLERAHPVVLEVSLDNETWREVARRTELFRTWRPSFTPTKARYVRLRALRRTHLHFKDVRIQAPPGAK
jgi:hypothetical protein